MIKLRVRRFGIVAVICIAGIASHAARGTAQFRKKSDVSALTRRVAALESRLMQAEAIRAIKRVQYSYAHYAELGLWFDLGDIFADKGVAHYPGGDFTGPDSLRKFFLQELGRGQLGLADGRVYPHIMIQPVVTMTPGGRRAKGRWHVIAMLGGYGTSASWAGGVYENEYVLEQDVWKISDLHYYSQYNARYAQPGVTTAKWNVPYHFDSMRAGSPIDKPVIDRSTELPKPNDVPRRVQQLKDETDVLNLQHTYGYYVDRQMWNDVADLFASDGTMELGQRGVYVGKDRIRRALNSIDSGKLAKTEVNDHMQLDTVVHVAPDGQSARARGIELTISGVHGKGAELEEGVFENEYAKQDGVWKIRSLHYYPRFHYPNPVTGRPVQYPQGVTSAEQQSKAEKSVSTPMTMVQLEKTIDNAIAYDTVENLVNAQAYYLDDSRFDNVDALYAKGSRVPTRQNPDPQASFAIYQTVQPVIHISSDGKSARIKARLLRLSGAAGGKGAWTAGIYEGRAVNEGGVWKLQEVSFFGTWTSSFDRWAPQLLPKAPAQSSAVHPLPHQ